MRITEHTPGDHQRLAALAAKERNADKRDRYRIALLALGGREKLEIAELLAIAKSTVERWAYAYRDRGVEALAGMKRAGPTPKISGDKAERLRTRVEAGATPPDKVCTLRGRDVQRIAKDELDVDISLNGVYRTLHRLGFSCLAPRPRHEKQDLTAQKKFKEESAPLLSAP